MEAEISLSWRFPIPAAEAPLPGLRFKALLALLGWMGLCHNPPWEERRGGGGLGPTGTTRNLERGLWTRAWSDRVRGNGFKLRKGSFRLDIGKEFFPLRVVRPWHRSPGEAADARENK